MTIKIIVAVDKKWGIGKDGKLPWHSIEDLKLFKTLTWGSPVIMGRKTFESLGEPLDGRINYVVSRNKEFSVKGKAIVKKDLFGAIEEAKKDILYAPKENVNSAVWIIGGAEVYKRALIYAQSIYMTVINIDSKADVYFPDLDDDWSLSLCTQEGDKFPHERRIYTKGFFQRYYERSFLSRVA